MTLTRITPLVIAALVPAVVLAQQPVASGNLGLKIEILNGEDGVNIIKKKTAVKPVVVVKDKNDLPIAGVAVVIGLGAAGVFDGGGHEATVVTNANGTATTPNFRPTAKGDFNIQVRASYQGQSATATIHQTNFSTVAAAQKAGRVPGSSSSSTSSSSSSASSSASNMASSAASAGGASAGGMSGLAVAGLVVGGVAAAGVGAAYATGIIGGKSTNGPNCSSQLNNLESVINSLQSCGTSLQCLQTTDQNLLNALGQACSCFGGTNAPSEYQSLIQQVIADLQQAGLNTSQYQACFQ